jgi:co-chaperonin GroES (HSP10)
MKLNGKGGWIKYEDHVAAMQEAYPQPKFKVGDRVQWDKDLGTVAEPDEESYPRREPLYVNVNWDDGNFGTVRLSDLLLYVPPVTTCGCPGGYVKEASAPEPKFKVGDRVRNDMFIGTVTSIETYEDQEDEFWVAWDKGGQSQCDYRTLTLYIPPTPAELIPTLVEHEWVRGVVIDYTNEPFSGYVYADDEMLWAGRTILIHGSGAVSTGILSIERCDAPEVVRDVSLT